jgi:hypothetical protein
MNPFITKVKSPRVKILMGKVKIIKIGLKMALRIPRIKAANKSAFKSSTWIIPNTLVTMKIDKTVMNHFNKKAFILYPFYLFIWKHLSTNTDSINRLAYHPLSPPAIKGGKTVKSPLPYGERVKVRGI